MTQYRYLDRSSEPFLYMYYIDQCFNLLNYWLPLYDSSTTTVVLGVWHRIDHQPAASLQTLLTASSDKKLWDFPPPSSGLYRVGWRLAPTERSWNNCTACYSIVVVVVSLSLSGGLRSDPIPFFFHTDDDGNVSAPPTFPFPFSRPFGMSPSAALLSKRHTKGKENERASKVLKLERKRLGLEPRGFYFSRPIVYPTCRLPH